MEDKHLYEVDVVIKKFAQKLAGNDKKTRDKALKALKRWFESKAKIDSGFKRTEMLQIWKGLHYNFWMSDKPIVQEDLAESISNMINLLTNDDTAYLYLSSFFETISREWCLIDSFRLDKFMMLVRRMLAATFVYIKKHDYNEKLVKKFSGLIYDFMLSKDDKIWCAPDGLKYHMLDIYFSELSRIASSDEGTLSQDEIMWFLEPYCLLIAHSKNNQLVSSVISTIFEEILRSGAYKAMQSELSDGDDDDLEAMSEDEDLSPCSDEEADDADMVATTENGDADSDEEPGLLDEDDYDEDDALTDSLIGKFPWDCNLVHDRLFNIARDKKCLSRNRDKIYKIVKKLQQLLSGTYVDQSLASEETYANEADMETREPNFKMKAATSELLTFESKLDKTTSKAYKLNEKKLKKERYEKLTNGEHMDSDEDDDDEIEAVEAEVIPEPSSDDDQQVDTSEALQSRAETFGMSDSKKRNRRRKKKENKPPQEEDSTTDTTTAPSKDVTTSPVKARSNGKLKVSSEELPKVNGSPALEQDSPSKSPRKKKSKNKKRKHLEEEASEDISEVEVSPKKKKQKKAVEVTEPECETISSPSSFSDFISDSTPDSTPDVVSSSSRHNESKKKKKKKKKRRKTLSDLDVQIDTSSPIINNASFLTHAMEKAKVFPKPVLSTPVNKLKQIEITSSKKKVLFKLNRNTQQEFIKTQSLASASPLTPFNPDSQPTCGILKERIYDVKPINLFSNKKMKKKKKKFSL